MQGAHSEFKFLPAELALFPIVGALLLPQGRLPLKLPGPRHVKMAHDAFANRRLIGIVQPKSRQNGSSEIYSIGCAGRIVNFEEAENGRFQIVLKGICRFDVVKELASSQPYRRILVDWHRYQNDLKPQPESCFDRALLLKTLQGYFGRIQMTCNKWDDLKNIPPEKLISTLAMVCPFTSEEKQALIEAPCLSSRAELLITMMDMALDKNQLSTCRH